MALPITARSTRCWASPPMVAPTSSTIEFPAHRRPHRRDRRAVDARQHVEIEPRHRHQRAGIAGRYRDIGLAFLDGVDGKPHRRGPAAVAQRLARLVVHADGDVGMDDARGGLQRRMRLEQRLDSRRSPNSRNSVSGWRASASSAPATTTEGRDRHPWRQAQCGPCVASNLTLRS